eukprot:195225_1
MALEIESLLKLNNDELSRASMNLVDNASTYDLKNCFENIFKESIMKYLLKIIIQKEIQQLTTHTTTENWKRLSLISRITKLKPTSQTNTASTMKKLNNNITTHRNIKNPSTMELLIDGFLRNEMNIISNIFPMDISLVCHQFIGNVSNIAIESLRLFSHKQNTIISSIQQDRPSQPITAIEYCPNKQSYPNIKLKLVSPNKILMTKQNTFFRLNCVKDSTFIEISDNMQILNNRTDLIYNNNDVIDNHGFVQCINTKKSQLLRFGGIKYKQKYNKAPQPAGNAIIAYDYGHTSKIVPRTIGKLIYGRAHMSLCNINNERIAVIGGQKKKKWYSTMNQMSMMGSSNIESVNHVELFDLNSNKSVLIKHLNYARVECGSYYNSYSNEIIVFGGNNGYDFSPMGGIPHRVWENSHHNNYISRSMEIYDFHKNVWTEVPYLSNFTYDKYPCIWTMGAQCICVAQ